MIKINESVVDQKWVTKLLRSVGFVKKKKDTFGRNLDGAWHYTWEENATIEFAIDFHAFPDENKIHLEFNVNYGNYYEKKFDDPDAKRVRDFVENFLKQKRLKITKRFEYPHRRGGAFLRYRVSGSSPPLDKVAKILVEYVQAVDNYIITKSFGKYEKKKRGSRVW